MENTKMNWNDAECALRAAVETCKQIVIDLVGEDSNVEMVSYNSHFGSWEIVFKEGEDMEFEDFTDLYEWLTTEGRE